MMHAAAAKMLLLVVALCVMAHVPGASAEEDFPTAVPTLRPTLKPAPAPAPTPVKVSSRSCGYTSGPCAADPPVGGPGPTSPTGPTGPCFSEVATVDALEGGIVTVKDLQVGDSIRTKSNDYQLVYAFGHYNSTLSVPFLRIELNNVTPVEITAEHLVFLEGQNYPVRADSVRIGDSLQSPIVHERGALRVTGIKEVMRKGFYAPMTKDGTLVVNGIVASAYAAIPDMEHHPFFPHRWLAFMCHFSMSPVRLICTTFLESGICQWYNEEGMPHILAWLVGLFDSIMAFPSVIRELAMMVYFLFAALCWFLEAILDIMRKTDSGLLLPAMLLSFFLFGMGMEPDIY
jgi:hypothetical protein